MGVDVVVLEVEDVGDVGSTEAVDRVVGDQPAGDEVVRVLDVEVEHRATVHEPLDGLDDVVAARLVEHHHACADAPRLRERQAVARARPGGTEPRDATQVDRRHRRDRLDHAHGCAVVLEAGLVAPCIAAHLGGPDGQPEPLERLADLRIAAADGDDVHRRAPAAVAAQGHRHVAAAALPCPRHVMRLVDLEVVLGEQLLPARRRVRRREHAIEQVLVADDAAGGGGAPRGKGQRRNPVLERDERLVDARLRLGLVRGEHPRGVRTLLHRPQSDAAHRPPRLGPGRGTRRPDPEAHVLPPLQVRHMQMRALAQLEAGEVRVLRRTDDPPARTRRDGDLGRAIGAVRAHHPRGTQVTGAVRGQHLVADPHLLDGLERPIGHRDRRALDEALRIVADDREVAVLGREQLEPAVLGRVRVLVLVDEDVAEGLRVAVADLLEEREEVDRAEEEVVEVHRVGAVELALIALVDVGDGLLEEGADELAVVVGRAQLVLRVGDLDLHRPRREALRVDVEVVEDPLDQPPLVRRVVDRELARVAELVGVGAEHPRAGRVEGHDPHRPGRPADEELDALAHLLRGLVGERDGEDLVRARLLGAQQMGDAVREDAGLARAGPGEDEQRSLARDDGLALGLVEPVEKGVGGVGGLLLGHVGSR